MAEQSDIQSLIQLLTNRKDQQDTRLDHPNQFNITFPDEIRGMNKSVKGRLRGCSSNTKGD